MTKTLHISLTGHRPNKLGGYNIQINEYKKLQADLEQYILYQLQSYDVVVGHSGLALGADTIWSKAILSMRNKYPNRVKFHAEIPFMNQHGRWFKQSDIDFWFEQVDNADFKSVYADLDSSATTQQVAKALNDRNIGMLDHADILLAVWDGTSGGTGNAVKYAESKNQPVQFIDPSNYFKKTTNKSA